MDDISLTVIVTLTVVATITSIISAILGMGGGILLLAAMYSVLPYTVVVPLHACVQLISNVSRVIAYIKSVSWKILGFFLIGAIPGLAVMAYFFSFVWAQLQDNDAIAKILIALFILYATYKKKDKQEHKYPLTRYSLLGSYAAPISLMFGATGPLLAPYFIRKDLSKETIVSTKAVCQAVVHSFKLLIFFCFWKFGWDQSAEIADKVAKYSELKEPGLMLVSMLVAAVVGTFIGKKLMKRVSEGFFRKFYVIVLNVAAFKILLVDGVWKLINP